MSSTTIEASAIGALPPLDTVRVALIVDAPTGARLVELSEQLSAAEAKVERLYARWQELEEIGT